MGEHQEGHRSTSSRSRQPSTSAGSGPTSTTIAERGPARSTSASPCPTSQATSDPAVGRPARGPRRTDQHRGDQKEAAADARSTGRRSSRGAASASDRDEQGQDGQRERTGPPPDRCGGQGSAALGDLDDPADAPAGDRCPTSRPSGGQSRPTSPPARPSTVAGPTAGAASTLAATATRLTWPEIAATTGVQASCAASGTATASATQRGSHRDIASRHARAEHQDAGGRQDGEGEPDRTGKPRIDQDEHQHRHPQRTHPALPAVVSQTDQGDRPHHRGAQDAGFGAREQHEPDHARCAHHEPASGHGPGTTWPGRAGSRRPG